MKYLKTFENLQEFQNIGQTIRFIVTHDEKYILYRINLSLKDSGTIGQLDHYLLAYELEDSGVHKNAFLFPGFKFDYTISANVGDHERKDKDISGFLKNGNFYHEVHQHLFDGEVPIYTVSLEKQSGKHLSGEGMLKNEIKNSTIEPSGLTRKDFKVVEYMVGYMKDDELDLSPRS